MFCPDCGAQLARPSNFCPSCGASIPPSIPETAPGKMSPQVHRTKPQTQNGSSVLAFVLALLALVFFGAVLGIPAWIIAQKDLRKIYNGIIPSDKKPLTIASLVIAIIGTFVTSTLLAVQINQYLTTTQIDGESSELNKSPSPLTANEIRSIVANRDAMIFDIDALRRRALAYRRQSGTYNNLTLPSSLLNKPQAFYRVVLQNADSLTIKGISNERFGEIGVGMGPDGIISNWTFTGMFLVYRQQIEENKPPPYDLVNR